MRRNSSVRNGAYTKMRCNLHIERLETRDLLSVMLVKDIVPGPAPTFGEFDNPGMTASNGLLYFGADDRINGLELWKSDGTAAGTVMVVDLNPGPAGSDPFWKFDLNGTLFFTATVAGLGQELWKTDGTAAGTMLVKDINPGAGDGFPLGEDPSFASLNGVLYFIADDGIHGRELWKSDGTDAGTELIVDLDPGQASAFEALNTGQLTPFAGAIYFVTNELNLGRELWRTDGTAAGTQLVKDINPGVGGSDPIMKVVDNTLYLRARTAQHGTELWRSDGTEAGTVLVEDQIPGVLSFNPSLPFKVGDTLFLSAFPSNSADQFGSELYKLVGADIQLVKDIDPGKPPSGPNYFADLNGVLIFRAGDILGHELWRSDGTEAGTVRVRDINPGIRSSDPRETTVVHGLAYFSASNNRRYTRELWQTDGTTAGTVMIDIRPGVPGSEPQYLTPVNNLLFFLADDGVHGRELWVAFDGRVAPGTSEQRVNITGMMSPSGSNIVTPATAESAEVLPMGTRLTSMAEAEPAEDVDVKIQRAGPMKSGENPFTCLSVGDKDITFSAAVS